MVRSGLVALLSVAITLFAFAQQPKPEKVLPLKKRIPPPNSAKYPSLREPSDWQNPFLVVVGEDGIAVGSAGDSPALGPTLAVKDVVNFLTRLPNRDWPYGLVVVVAEAGVGTPGEASRVKRRNEFYDLMDRLRGAGVRVKLWGVTG